MIWYFVIACCFECAHSEHGWESPEVKYTGKSENYEYMMKNLCMGLDLKINVEI